LERSGGDARSIRVKPTLDDTTRLLVAVGEDTSIKDSPVALEKLALPFGLVMRGRSLSKYISRVAQTEVCQFMLRVHKKGWFNLADGLKKSVQTEPVEDAPAGPVIDPPVQVAPVGDSALLPPALGSYAASALPILHVLNPLRPPRISSAELARLTPEEQKARKQAQARLRVQKYRKLKRKASVLGGGGESEK
jgi:hypothetical protein